MSRANLVEQSIQPLRNTAQCPTPQVASTGWLGSNFTATRLAGAGVGGGYGIQVECATTTPSQLDGLTIGVTNAGGQISVKPGTYYRPAVFARITNGVVSKNTRLRTEYRDSSGSTFGTVYDTATTVIGRIFTRVIGNRLLVPAGAVLASTRLVKDAAAIDWIPRYTNLATNPEAVTVDGGAHPVGYTGSENAAQGDGTDFGAMFTAKWVAAAAGAHRYAYSIGTALAPSTQYTVRATVRSNIAQSGNLRVEYRTNVGTSTGGIVALSDIVLAAGAVTDVVFTVTTNSTPTTSSSGFAFIASTVNIGDMFEVTKMMVLAANAPGCAYFSGLRSSDPLYPIFAWDGTANASTSHRNGDTIVADRFSTMEGEYSDGNTPGWKWTSTAYGSESIGWPYTLGSVLGGASAGNLVADLTVGTKTGISIPALQGRSLYAVYDVTDQTDSYGMFAYIGSTTLTNGRMAFQTGPAGSTSMAPRVDLVGGSSNISAATANARLAGRHVGLLTLNDGMTVFGQMFDGVLRADQALVPGAGINTPLNVGLATISKAAPVKVLAFDRPHSPTIAHAVEAWLANKYGFALAA